MTDFSVFCNLCQVDYTLVTYHTYYLLAKDARISNNQTKQSMFNKQHT